MRVLHVITELDLLMGGPPQALRVLAQAQAAIGTDVTVLPCRITHGPQALEPGVQGRLEVLEPVTRSSLKWVSPSLKRAMLAADERLRHSPRTWDVAVSLTHRTTWWRGRPGRSWVIRPYGNLGIATRAHKGRIKALYWKLIEKGVFTAASGIHCSSEKEEREFKTLGLDTRNVRRSKSNR